VGVADARWGERVCAAVVPRGSGEVTEDELRTFVKTRLAPYKVPKQILMVADLPRNAMGKVTKPAVRDLFLPSDER
jgi:malonyl-CoA/methylmalonyl-CoA synthetase